MTNLLFVSGLWAFSFGLIKRHLSGLDPSLVAGLRLLLSFLVFLPWLRLRPGDPAERRSAGRFLLLGGVQFGLMYAAYQSAFRHLGGAQIALLTVFTPIFVALLEDARSRRLRPRNLGAALLATAAAAVILYAPGRPAAHWKGFLLVQASNLCFAAGQVYYRILRERQPCLPARRFFALAYLGGLLAVLPIFVLSGPGNISLNTSQILALGYLGVLASGVGFFLWNRGAASVSAGVLAVMNNLKIPLGAAASLLVFGEKTDLPRLLAGGALILAALGWTLARPKSDRG